MVSPGHAARFAFWALLTLPLVFLLLLYVAGDSTQSRRDSLLDRFQTERQSRVIALIHRQEQVSVLGLPIGTSIDIEDSEAILRAIRLTPDDQPIDLILHTPGGLVLAAEQIASALAEHSGKTTVLVPHYARVVEH